MLLREHCARFKAPLVVYDPFCGNGVLLVTAYLFFNERIPRLLRSELDALLLRKLEDPSADIRSSRVIDAIVEVITNEALAHTHP